MSPHEIRYIYKAIFHGGAETGGAKTGGAKTGGAGLPGHQKHLAPDKELIMNNQ